MAAPGRDAYCTLLMTDSYLPGAMVLGHSLKDNGAKFDLVAFYTPDTVSAAAVKELGTVWDEVLPIDKFTSRNIANLQLMDRLDLSGTFTKIGLWTQTQFRRLIYIDADVVALRAPDELFDTKADFSAVPDVGWPDCFNTGFMVLKPNMGDYHALKALADRNISFDGADQGLLNMHFSQWNRLSFTYNCTPSGSYQYVPAYRHFQSTISMIHFIGRDKPWSRGREAMNGSGVYSELLTRWWAVYDKHYKAEVAPERGYVPGNFSIVKQFVRGENASIGQTQITQRSSNDVQIQIHPPAEDAQPAEPIPDRQHVPSAPFEAPANEWNAMYSAPPSSSKPEAANFPETIYTMSSSRDLFVAPKYSEPPKNLWYEIPQKPVPGTKAKPLFPWEENQDRPSRIFLDDSVEPSPAGSPELANSDPIAEVESDRSSTSLSPPIVEPVAEPFSPLGNAWDDIPGINRYVNAYSAARARKVSDVKAAFKGRILSPTSPSDSANRLTSFPTASERPSLPVTPAPRRKTSWGEDEAGVASLPSAVGVPSQDEWDPLAKLNDLALKQSKLLEQRANAAQAGTTIPLREHPGSPPAPSNATTINKPPPITISTPQTNFSAQNVATPQTSRRSSTQIPLESGSPSTSSSLLRSRLFGNGSANSSPTLAAFPFAVSPLELTESCTRCRLHCPDARA